MAHPDPRSGFVGGLKNADIEAWRGLYAQFGGMVYRLARGMVGAAAAEDVAQETFLQVFRKRNQFRGVCAKEFETWMYRIALNKCRDWRRKRQSRPVLVAVHDLAQVGGDMAPFENRLDEIDLLQEGLQRLRPNLRALLLLHLAGRSYREIGTILKIKSKGTVSERLGLAREELRRSLIQLGWSE